MNKKISIGIVIALVFVLGLSFWLNNREDEPVVDNDNQETVSVVYSDGEVEVPATFYNGGNKVEFYHEDLGDVSLETAVSASGARYANADESLVFWEHQGELTIYVDDEEAFVGRIKETPDYSNLSLIGKWDFDKAVISNEDITFKQNDKFSINFQEDGSVNGTTDCNNFMGSYEVEEAESSLSFSALATTMMYCESSEESDYLSFLESVKSYSFASPEELVINLEGDDSLHFTKSNE